MNKHPQNSSLALFMQRNMKCVLLYALLTNFSALNLFSDPIPKAPVKSSVGAGPSTTDSQILGDLNLDFPGMQAVRAAAQSHDLSSIKQAYLVYRRTASTAKWEVMPEDMPRTAMAEDDPIGDEVLRHHIRNDYGFSPHAADMGLDFDWTFNPVPRGREDFSYEWTWCAISRTQFWKKLVDAYWKTHNEKYAQEWVNELEDFAVKNPRVGDGANGRVPLWRTLDAAIRMSDSWPYAYYHVLDSQSFTAEAQWTYLKLMRDHGILLEDGLKDPNRTGNWVSTECFGLYTIGTLFPELKESTRWRQIAIDRISKEMDRMVPPDGFEAELTPNYHMVALDGFLGPLKLAALNHNSVPQNLQAKILSMYRALVIVMEQNGDVVSTNDSPDLNAIKTSREGLKLAYDPLLDWAVSGGKRGTGLPDSTMLPYAGFYTMRGGWKPDDLFLFFRAGPTGIGHQHEDMLQVVLKDWGKTLLLEPGTSLYDHSDWRRFIVGTESHNTITVDGKWQHRGASTAPVTTIADNPWITTPLYDYAASTYRGGYQKNVYDPQKQFYPMDWVGDLDHSVTHTRRVLYLRPYYVLLLDTIDGRGKHAVDSHFDVDSPSVRIDPSNDAAFSQNKDNVQIGLYPLERDGLSVQVIQGAHGAPDIQWNIPTVQFHKRQAAPIIFGTFLYPYKKNAPKFDSSPLSLQGVDVWGRSIHTEKEDAEIAIVKNGRPASFVLQSTIIGQIEITSGGLLVRRPKDGRDALIGSWDLSSYESSALIFTTNIPANLLIAMHNGHPVLLNNGEAAIQISLQRPFLQAITLPPSHPMELDAKEARPIDTRAIFSMP